MADHWVENHKRDSWRKQAKASGYRARSAFKLKQIQERFNLVREGDYVLDVGCHPGGWAQVAVELVGEDGKVIGVDLQSCAPVEGAVLLTGDITDPITQERILGELEDEPLNVIVSDISPHEFVDRRLVALTDRDFGRLPRRVMFAHEIDFRRGIT